MRVIFVAGAIFFEVGASLFVAGVALREIARDSRSTKGCILPYKMRLQDGTGKLSEAAGARGVWSEYRWIMLGFSSDHGRIVFVLAEAIGGFLLQS